MADIQKTSRRVKELAILNGFGLAAVAPVGPDEKDVSFWKSWLQEGRHGEMGYLENPKKASVAEWYPEAKSILMVGLFYETHRQTPKPGEGKLATYAVYPEYQKRMNKMLKALLKNIQEEMPGAQGRLFADTSPVLERMYARLSGMGWIGKNTMLLHPQEGSFFFLGGLALNLELEPDSPAMDHCGTCSRCIEACPTQALTPYQMNASRCIAYLTIEKRSVPSSPELQKKTGNWIFGCDICQEVCPFNRDSSVIASPEGARQSHQDHSTNYWLPLIPNTIPLPTILNWSEEDFKKYFKGTPVKRAKWKGMLRNALIAAFNSKDENLLQEIRRFENHPDPDLAALASDLIKQPETRV